MQDVDQILHAEYIIPGEADNRILDNHALIIKDKKILDILPSDMVKERYHSKDEQHYKTHALLPGFVNCHTHSAMVVFRGLADDLELMDWLNNYIWPAETKWVSEEMVYEASLLAIAEMIRCGTTCFNDMYFFPEATARAAIEAGLRAALGMTIIDVPTAWAKTTEEYFQKSMQFYEAFHNQPLITPTLAPHSTYTVTLSHLIRVKELANQLKLKINIHLQEDPGEMRTSLERHNKLPLQRLHEVGFLDENVIAIHMTQVSDDDFDILEKTKPSIVNCPESNLKLASGYCPVEQLLHLGINVALGTDGAASNNDLDMLSEMRSAALVGKIFTSNPRAVSAPTTLKMATLNGAKALGLDHLIGSLTPGKSADFIAIDFNYLETQPLYHPISQIVYAASRHQVSDVWVQGKQLMRNRQLLTLDEKRLFQIARKWRDKIKTSL